MPTVALPAPPCPPRRSVRRKRRPPPWTRLPSTSSTRSHRLRRTGDPPGAARRVDDRSTPRSTLIAGTCTTIAAVTPGRTRLPAIAWNAARDQRGLLPAIVWNGCPRSVECAARSCEPARSSCISTSQSALRRPSLGGPRCPSFEGPLLAGSAQSRSTTHTPWVPLRRIRAGTCLKASDAGRRSLAQRGCNREET